MAVRLILALMNSLRGCTCKVVVHSEEGATRGSLGLGWRLPVYRSRPPRPESPKR